MSILLSEAAVAFLSMELMRSDMTEQEACGFILGDKAGNAISIVPVRNVSENPYEEFVFDADEQLFVMQNYGWLLGVYHTHLRGDAYPSRRDILSAAYPQWHYVILTKEQLRSFIIVDGEVDEEELLLPADLLRG